MDWKEIVRQFGEEQKQFDLQDLCEWLLEVSSLDAVDEVVEYLKDYRAIDQAKLDFHIKWKHIPNMEKFAEYDKKEIAGVDELIARLQKFS